MCAVVTAVSSRRDRKMGRPLNRRKASMSIFGAGTAVPLDEEKRACVLVIPILLFFS